MRRAAWGTATVTDYLVDAHGQRVRKRGTLGTVVFVYDEAGKLLGEYDAAGTPQTEYLWLDDTPVALVRTEPAGAALYYLHADHLEAPRAITDTAGNLRWRWRADPFGSPPEDNPAGLGAFTFNLRFPGQYFDHETGLYYNYFRDYDPVTGRYVQSDPIGLAGGINTYSYVNGNPLSYVDPTGEVAFLALAPLVGGGSTGLGSFLSASALFGTLTWAIANSDNPSTQAGSEEQDQCKVEDHDDCKQKASDWELKQAGIDAHEVKKGLGQVRLFEICKCKSGGFAVKRRGCQGPIIFRL